MTSVVAQERPDWCVDPAFIAVFDNDIESLREFINNGGDVRAHDDICHSLLSLAIVLGRKQAVDMLIEAGADVDEKLMFKRDEWMSNEPRHPFRPCQLAALQPDEAIVKALIAANADLSAIGENKSLVCHFAAENTNEQVIVALLDAGAQPNALNFWAWTPIHVAARNPNAEVMKALINALRSDIARVIDEVTDRNKGAIHFAAENPNASVLKLILDAGANVDLTGIDGNTACHFAADREEHLAALLEHKCSVNVRNDGGLIPCHKAAACGTLACLSMMLAAGGDVFSVARDGLTLLHCAAANRDESVLKVVIEAMGATSNDALKSRSKFGQTPPHYAAANPNVNVTAMLLRLDTSTVALESRNDKRETPLLVAAEWGSIAVVQALLAAGACTTDVDDQLNSLCHRGVKNSDRAVISLIVTLPDVNKDAVNRDGKTPCHVALLAQKFDCANVLIDAGANVNAADYIGTTIGHLMAVRGTADQLRMLLRRGVDIRAKDIGGRSICDNANADCLALLFAVGADLHTNDRDRLALNNEIQAKELRDSLYVLNAAGIELSASSIELRDRANRVLGTDKDELQHIAKAQVRLIVLRGFEVCTGLQSFQLPALVTCEILAHAFAPHENSVPFHILWKIVTTCKHFK